MTSPSSPASVTPDPSIHTDTTSTGTQAPNLSGLAGMFAQLPLQIISMIVNAIFGTLESLPIVGPLLTPLLQPLQNLFANLFSMLGISTPSGLTATPSASTTNSLVAGLGSIPILGPFISSLVGAFTGGNPPASSSGSPAGSSNPLTNIISDLMSALGNPLGLGTGTTTTTTGGGSNGAGGTVTGGVNIFTDIINGIMGLLSGLGGALGSGTATPPFTLPGLSPGTSNNALPDNFANPTTLAGDGLWVWDWPENTSDTWSQVGWPGSPGCVRTARPGAITIFWVQGVQQLSPGQTATGTAFDVKTTLKDLTGDVTVAQSFFGITSTPSGTNLLDWTHFDWIHVPYVAALYPLGASIAQGVSELINLIKVTPGKFIILAASMGGYVASNVYDEIRYGSLQDRNDDLVMGIVLGNMRREKGRTFPGGPLYCSGGYGIGTPTLQNTEDRWWEWSVGAGTYPAFGNLNGYTFTQSDPVSCVPVGNGSNSAEAQWRALCQQDMAATTVDSNQLNQIGSQLANNPYGAMLVNPSSSGSLAHGLSFYMVQPFLAQGDTRTFWQYVFASINNQAHLVPPVAGIRHQLEGIPLAVQPGQVIAVGASVEWVNMPATAKGNQIMVGANVFDKNGALLGLVTDPHLTIKDPAAESDWVALSANIEMPANAATAMFVLDVEPAAMTTATVWFRDPVFEPTQTIDAALLGNVTNLPQLPQTGTAGTQGAPDLHTTLNSVVDGVTSANTGTNVTNQPVSAMLASVAQTAANAQQALALAQSLNNQINGAHAPVSQSWTTHGQYTFNLPSWAASGVFVDIIPVGAGGGGGARTGFTSGTGTGGFAGSWAPTTYIIGSQIPNGTTQLTVTVGQGGTAGSSSGVNNGDGGGGGASSVTASGMTTVAGAGGAGGPGNTFTDGTSGGMGQSPGNDTYRSVFYPGGHAVDPGNPGSPAGGGGGACVAFGSADGFAGADGSVWIVVRQT